MRSTCSWLECRHSPLDPRALLPLPSDVVDPSCGALECGLVEEERRRIRDGVRGPVEVVRAAGGIQRVADRNLVADDEHVLLRPVEERAEPARISPRRVVEALAAGKGIAANVLALPGPV